MARNPFYQLDVIGNASKKGNFISDCYRLMYKKELWIQAYSNLYLNAGNQVKETAVEISRGFSLPDIDDTIEQLKAGTFRFSFSSKPLPGAPYLSNLLTQEVIRMILARIYEPVFSEYSRGYKGESCHTVLSQIRDNWSGLTWCIGGNLKDVYNQLDHSLLVKLIGKKINDYRFLLLIHHALKGSVRKHSTKQKPFCHTPQGSRISHLLVNIYLHEFDLFMEKQMKVFDKRKIRRGQERKQIEIPSTASQDDQYKRIRYIRYANDFIIGIASSKQIARNMKEMVKKFLEVELHFYLSNEKMHVTHLEKSTPFLGFVFRKVNKRKVKQVTENSQPLKKGDHLSSIKLEIPDQKLKEFAIVNGYGDLDSFKIVQRAKLLNNSELEIMDSYNTELSGIANYYKLADNFHQLHKLFYLAESSFIKTIASKRRSSSMKVTKSMKAQKQGALCLLSVDKEGCKKLHQFVKLKDLI